MKKYFVKETGKLYVPKGGIFKGQNDKLVVFGTDQATQTHNQSHLKYKKKDKEGMAGDDGKIPAAVSAEDTELPAFREENGIYYFPYRQLSATIVGADSWKATDFSRENVLRDATNLFNRIPAYKNHVYYVGNGIGQVVNPTYSEAYVNSMGQEIPAGIEAEFALDSSVESRKDLIADLKSMVNPYNACSVGIDFMWEASHEFEDIWDFYMLLGTTIVDDEGNESMVRRIATEIVQAFESSLVSFGADSYARQKKKDGSVSYSKADMVGTVKYSDDPLFNEYSNTGKYFVFTGEKAKICESEPKTINLGKEAEDKAKNENSNSMPKHLENYLKLIFGVDSVDKITEDMAKEGEGLTSAEFSRLQQEATQAAQRTTELETERNQFKTDAETAQQESATLKAEKEQATTQLQEANTKLETANTNLATAKQELDAANSSIEENKGFVEFGKAAHKQLVADTKKAYRGYTLSGSAEFSQTIEDEIDNTVDFELLTEKANMFGAKLGVSGKCGKCGSENIVLRSSKPHKEDGDGGNANASGGKKMWEILREMD